jgi:hypothetical protein
MERLVGDRCCERSHVVGRHRGAGEMQHIFLSFLLFDVDQLACVVEKSLQLGFNSWQTRSSLSARVERLEGPVVYDRVSWRELRQHGTFDLHFHPLNANLRDFIDLALLDQVRGVEVGPVAGKRETRRERHKSVAGEAVVKIEFLERANLWLPMPMAFPEASCRLLASQGREVGLPSAATVILRSGW